VFPIVRPPLRQRREDIPRLVEHLAQRAARKLGRELEAVSPAFVERACAYEWPGNIRELENVIERALIMSGGRLLDGGDLFTPVAAAPAAAAQAGGGTLEDMERAYITRVLEDTRWQIEGERGAAHILGLNPSTLRGRLRKLGIRKTS
jgi:DNA-binding NtrC family response regulator